MKAKYPYYNDILGEVTVAILGFGNQGHAHALNLRDSGWKVIVGGRPGLSSCRGRGEGFQVFSIGEAVRRANLIMCLVPDESLVKIYEDSIFPNLNQGKILGFAHGYNLRFAKIKPSVPFFIVLLKAPVFNYAMPILRVVVFQR